MSANSMHPKVQKLLALRGQVQFQTQQNDLLRRSIEQSEIAARQGLKNVNSPQDVQDNLKSVLPSWMMPGNVGDINKICWPFWFTTQRLTLPPNAQGKASINVTQEAAMIVTKITKNVFTQDEEGLVAAIDPSQPGQAGKTPGLALVLQDAQSSRVFMDRQLKFDNIGYGVYPTELETPQMFLPNSLIEVQMFNQSAQTTYIPFVTFHGVRCRIEDAQRILSMVTG